MPSSPHPACTTRSRRSTCLSSQGLTADDNGAGDDVDDDGEIEEEGNEQDAEKEQLGKVEENEMIGRQTQIFCAQLLCRGALSPAQCAQRQDLPAQRRRCSAPPQTLVRTIKQKRQSISVRR